MPSAPSLRAALVLWASILTGCMSWSPGWESPYRPQADAAPSAENVEALGDPAKLFAVAGDGESLRLALHSYERALEERPGDYGLLVRLSEIHILRGAAYSASRHEKAESYRTGIRLAEQAMATQPAFQRLVESGAPLQEAVQELGEGEMKAMLLWVTGVSYYFKECLGGVGHVVNFRWMARTRETMEHMMEVDPDYEHGAVVFSMGVYYLALPPSAGGDMARARELIDRAVEMSDGHILSRWGRAKYLSSALGDRTTFEEDLSWVLAQDPRTASSPYPWNVYMQRDAAEMLARIDRIVPDGR